MKQFFRLYCLAFYTLSFLSALLLGLMYAGFSEAGKNQGLAGGAIVLGYGVIGAVLGLIAAIVLVSFLDKKLTIRINIVLLMFILGSVAYFKLAYDKRTQLKEEQTILESKKPVGETDQKASKDSLKVTSVKSMLRSRTLNDEDNSLGLFAPNFYDNKVFYFYGNPAFSPNLEAIDSMVFTTNGTHSMQIESAPPWLVPEHLKMDYELLYFKVVSLDQSYVEIVVDKNRNITYFVEKTSGVLQFWPEFILSVYAVELIDPANKLYFKPSDQSSEILSEYEFLRPVRIKQEWIHVELVSRDNMVVEKAWIKWMENGKLLIRYSFLS